MQHLCVTTVVVIAWRAGFAQGSSDSVELDFASVVYSNLGGKGPDAAALHGLRFGHVAEVQGQLVDLMIEVDGEEDLYDPGLQPENGNRGPLGSISVATGTGVSLVFKVLTADTSQPALLNRFYFTAYDLDQAADDQQESMTVGGFSSVCTSDGTEVATSEAGPGRLRVRSTAFGNRADDPTSPNLLTAAQLRRAVTFTFERTSEFRVRLEVAGNMQTRQGRPFLFSGRPLPCAIAEQSVEAEPYNCNSGLFHFQDRWTEGKKKWCCEHHRVGCALPPADEIGDSDHYDCQADIGSWKLGWSRGKMDWCCTHFGIACTTSPGPSTSNEVDAIRFDCTADFGQWQRVWSDQKVRWCCTNLGIACTASTTAPVADTTMPPYNCDTGLVDWERSWTPAKKMWCCVHEKKGCTSSSQFSRILEQRQENARFLYTREGQSDAIPFDCSKGFADWESGWSAAKKHWCCENTGTGCENVVPGGDGKVAIADCNGHEREWAECEGLPACNSCEPKNCEFSEWTDWFKEKECTGLCVRQRYVLSGNNECGKPCTGPKVETSAREECWNEYCRNKVQDCEWNPWSEWTECDPGGDTQSTRERTIAVQPEIKGKPCMGVSKETRPCTYSNTGPVDCLLGEWEDWTKCSASCGGGWMSQMRRVVRHASNGGIPCGGVTSHMYACNTQLCGNGETCELSDWEPWEGCSQQNSHQQYRTRRVLSNGAGEEGFCNYPLRETAGCSSGAAPFPCELTEWTGWSECSAPCEGNKFRVRHIKDNQKRDCYADQDLLSLTSTAPCGPSSCKADQCYLSAWSDWTECSHRCGVGINYRTRVVESAGRCDASLKDVKDCTNGPCEVLDCIWGDWDDWSGCSSTCGGGTKRRSRVIEQSPVHGGKLCDPLDKSQVTACNTESCNACIDGKFGDWSEWGACSSTCSPGFRVRHRNVERHANHCGKPANGLEDEYEICRHLPPCTSDRDCEFTAWSEWSDCSRHCNGQHSRSRHVAQYAGGAGKPCGGSVRDIGPCNPQPGEDPPYGCDVRMHTATANPLEGLSGEELEQAIQQLSCKLSDWSAWGVCSRTCGGGQNRRYREIQTAQQEGGRPCEGEMVEMGACNTQHCHVGGSGCRDCIWGDWSDWGACSHEGNQHYRHRSIIQMPNDCGTQCRAGEGKEVSACDSTPEPYEEGQLFCSWSAWTDLGECGGTCEHPTKMKQRDLHFTRREWGGEDLFSVGPRENTPCAGSQINVTTCQNRLGCGNQDVSKDCRFGAWSEWTEPRCTGLCERHRVIEQNGENGGIICDGPMVETKRCEKHCSEPQDCEFTDWSAWTQCMTADEQSMRHREVAVAPAMGGLACDGPIVETVPCDSGTAGLNCEVSEWTLWSTCSRTCGGGIRNRKRSVDEYARDGGVPCSDILAEMQACHTQSCQSGGADCEFQEWTEWSSCDGGKKHQKRTRKIEAEAAEGGLDCNGAVLEVRSCSEVGVDCRVSPWTDWGQCDRPCGSGQHQRHRQVTQNPTGAGRQCPRSMIETAGCNRSPCNIREPDADVGPWSDWGECSVTCGSGQKVRARRFTRMAEDVGRGYTGELSEAQACTGSEGDICKSTCRDCVWGSWSSWSQCNAPCGGGQKSRGRKIVQLPDPGCKICEAADKEQIAPCNTQKCGDECIDGEWDTWSDWEFCSRTCKGGITWRSRRVARQPTPCGRPAVGDSIQHASCNEDIPCLDSELADCKFTQWGRWSECRDPCYGVKRRTRDISQHASEEGQPCRGALMETFPCDAGPECRNTQTGCELSQWVEWGACDVSCGGGQSMRSREVLRGGGANCDRTLTETRPCSMQACADSSAACTPIDCHWNDWSDWGECDQCGGEMKRHRRIVSQPKCGGRMCEAHSAEEVQRCPRSCNHEMSYCIWGPWRPYEECSSTCAGAVKSRVRYLHKSAVAELGVPTLPEPEPDRALLSPATVQSTGEAAGSFSAPPVLPADAVANRAQDEQPARDHPHDLGFFDRDRGAAGLAAAQNDANAFAGLGLGLKFEDIERRAQSLERRRFRHLVMAFAGGAASFAAVLVVFIRASRLRAASSGAASTASISVEPDRLARDGRLHRWEGSRAFSLYSPLEGPGGASPSAS